MRPSEVLDHQASLYDMLASRPYINMLDGFTASMSERSKLGTKDDRGNDFDGSWLSYVERSSLRIAQAYHVQKDMMPLLRAAAMDLDITDYLVHERLPAEHGFLMFDEPLENSDVWGERWCIYAIHWRHGTVNYENRKGVPGIWYTMYSNIYDQRDETNQRLIKKHGLETLQQLGTYHLNHLAFMPYEQRVGPQEVPTPEDYMKWAEEGVIAAEYQPNDNRLLVALFRLLGQTLVDVSEADIDRATRRRMLRMKLPPRVTTIKLRRVVKPTTGDREFVGALHHRFPVRGSWQWRKCSERHPLAEPYEKGWHARIYVGPFWKGPESAPIMISQKVWDLSR